MADIFISYSSEDRARVKKIVELLESQGWSIWWDRIIPPGRTFDEVIEEEISKAKCIVVVWSKNSVNSSWVRNEAEEANRRRILVPVLIDDINIPFPFRRIQAAKFIEWGLAVETGETDQFLTAISGYIGLPSRKVSTKTSKTVSKETERKVLNVEIPDADIKILTRKPIISDKKAVFYLFGIVMGFLGIFAWDPGTKIIGLTLSDYPTFGEIAYTAIIWGVVGLSISKIRDIIITGTLTAYKKIWSFLFAGGIGMLTGLSWHFVYFGQSIDRPAVSVLTALVGGITVLSISKAWNKRSETAIPRKKKLWFFLYGTGICIWIFGALFGPYIFQNTPQEIHYKSIYYTSWDAMKRGAFMGGVVTIVIDTYYHIIESINE
jgi:hypothetical protein